MYPPPRSSPFGELHGCEGDGCASDQDTWPLHHVLRSGVHCRLCCSCILLSHRSLYCCRCFLLVTSPSCNYDNGDTLMAPPAPTVTCQVCHDAVAHLPCLYPPPTDGVFVCPPCTAAQNGRPFTYAPPCRQPLDERNARVLVLGARIALALLQRHATAAREAAERLAMEARDARARAHDALIVAFDLDAEEDLSCVVPQPTENDLAASEEEEEEEEDSEAETDEGEVMLVRRNVMPPLVTPTIDTGGSVVPLASAEAKHMPPLSQPKLLFDLNENAAENEIDDAQAEPMQHQALNSFNVKEVAMAAGAEATRASPSTPQTLQLFPITYQDIVPRTLQLFNDDDEEM